MIRKYNIALTPETKNEHAVKLARQFSDIADQYLLGEKSLPHLTLCRFEAEESDVDRIWMNVSSVSGKKSLHLTFREFSYVTFNNTVFWVSLLPDECDVLNEMHRQLSANLHIPINKNFDPHMTLMSSKNKFCEKVVRDRTTSYKPISDNFILSLGKSDEIGQLTELVYACEPIR